VGGSDAPTGDVYCRAIPSLTSTGTKQSNFLASLARFWVESSFREDAASSIIQFGRKRDCEMP